MKVCPNCGRTLDDNVVFCVSCGCNLSNPNPVQAPPPGGYYPPVQADPKDHTSEYTAEDISDNKVIAMLPYIAGFMGIIIALLAINHSKFVAFHVKQALKIQVVSILTSILTVLLCVTVIVPAVGGVFLIVLFVVKIICFFNVCKGKAKEAPIVSGFGFLN